MEQVTTAADIFVCPNCETETPGHYCFHCGQKRYLRAEKGVATQLRLVAIVLLVIMSVLVLPTFAAGRYVRTLLP